MLLFISTGTYFKLFDLEISGYLAILEMIGNDICTGIEFIFCQRVILVPFHPEMFTNCIWEAGLFLSYTLFS